MSSTPYRILRNRGNRSTLGGVTMSKYDDFYCESLGGACINEGDCDNCAYGNEKK